MRHPTEGVLRRLLDEPAGVTGADREHVVHCAQCSGRLAVTGDDAALVERALADDDGGAFDVETAWQRLATAAAAPEPARAAAPTRARRRRPALRRPAAAAVAVAVALTGASAAAAGGWLQVFRTERIATVSFSASDLLALPDLRAYGELEVAGGPDVHEVPDAATAAAETGLDVPEVTDLPAGIVGTPVYQVGRQVSATFTFSTQRATRAAAAAGKPLPPAPPGVDGARVRLVAGPGVAAVWSSAAGAPGLLVGRAVAPTAFSSGIEFDVLRDYLLSLPGLPADVAAQLRTFAADGSTLPLPVPAGQITTTAAQVHGAPATVLEARDRTMAAVVWVDDGAVTAVAGSLDVDEVLAVARDLR